LRTYIFTLLTLGSLALADQVVMKNGDRVTGSIVKKDAAKLTVKSVNFGTVTLPWDQVASIKSDKPLTVVAGPTKRSVEGPIATAKGDNIVVASATGPETYAPKDIVAIRNADEQKAYLRFLHPKLTELWVMSGNLGFAGTSGNARTHTLTLPINLIRATNSDKITVHFNLIRSGATVDGVSSPTASAIRGGWAYNRNLAPKVFASTVNDYEHDRFQNLDLRAIFGGGLGLHAWKTEHGFIDVTSGGDYNHEAFSPTTTATSFSRSLAELYWGDNIGWKPARKVSFTHSYRMFNDLTNTGEFRQNADFAVSLAVTKHFTWNTTTSDHYLTNPPVGLKRNDVIYSTGLGFQFAR
jgi:putative salt-induced outer membrane protein